MSSPIRRNPITRRLCRNPITRRLMRCCGAPTAPWYILATPCGTGAPTGGPCVPAQRPFVWVCVDALMSDTGQTIRQALGPTAGCVTFLFNGWCYSVCYLPDGDSSLTTRTPPREPGSPPVVECGDAIQVVARRPYNGSTPGYNPADCGTTACPTGINYVQALTCGGEPLSPPVYVCAGQVTRRLVTRQFGGCACVGPGAGIDAVLIPPGARVFNSVAYPENNPGPVDLNGTILAEFHECCECLPACDSAPLRGNPNNPCCCGTVTLIAYATSWHVRRAQDNGDWQQIDGNATSSTPNIDGTLPVRYTVTTYIGPTPDYPFPRTITTTADVALPAPGFECGFPYLFGFPGGTGGSFPPPTWCEYGRTDLPCHQDGMGGYLGYDLVGRFGWPTILPNIGTGGQDAQQGTLTGVCNASCTSLAAELLGTLRNNETQETYEARYNINLTYNNDLPAACRGACGSFKPLITEDSVAQTDNPALLLP